MEIIELSQRNILLLLNSEDVIRYKLKDVDFDSMRDGFQRVILDSGLDSDFFSDVLVQIFDSKSGGCEMFVTKLEESKSPSDDHKPYSKMFVYMFSDIDNLTKACNMLSDIHTGTAFAYYDDAKKNYYLMLEKDNTYISEFNARRCKDSAVEYLNEYCLKFSDNAIADLSTLA